MTSLAVDPDILMNRDTCLMLLAVGLNILWLVLFAGWMRSEHKTPPAAQFVVAISIWAIALGVLLQGLEPRQWFLGFAIANGTFLAALHPSLSICFSLALIFMRPWELLPDVPMMLEIPRFSMMFSAIWALIIFATIDRFALRLNHYLLLLAAFVAWLFLSTLISSDPLEAKTVFNDSVLRAVIIGVLIHHLIRDRFSVWALRETVVVTFACIGVMAIYLYFSGAGESGRLEAFGLVANSNDVAAIMVILIVLAAFPFFDPTQGTSLFVRLASLLPICIGLLAILLSQSRGAMLALCAAASAHFLVRMKRKGLAVALVLAIAIAGYGTTRILRRSDAELNESRENRMSFLISGARMLIHNPITGVGLGQFGNNYETYAVSFVSEYGKRTAHSSWVLPFAETGLLGGALFLALYIAGSIRPAIRMLRTQPGWLYLAIAYGVTMSFLSHTYLMFPYVVTGLTTAAALSYAAKGGVVR